jgi:hypothetical protein
MKTIQKSNSKFNIEKEMKNMIKFSRLSFKIFGILVIIFLLMLGSETFAQVYVDIDNSGSQNGNSWSNAYTDIQDGIDAAYNAGGGEVWVAEGVYYQYESSGSNTLALKEGVYLYGGFNGTETDLEQRDWNANPTIIDGKQSSSSSNQVEHVVTANMDYASTVWTDGLIDGFTIQGGNSEIGGFKSTKATSPDEIIASDGAGAGAGLLMFQAAPEVSNCIITGNSAGKAGGLYVMLAESFPPTGENPIPVFTNVIIEDNFAQMRGGGLQCDLASHPEFVNCIIRNNECEAKGGGVYNDFGCSPTFINCLLYGNLAQRASGMGNDGSSSPILINCTVTDNWAKDMGAGIYTGSYNPDAEANIPTLVNCIVWGNDTDWGGPKDLRVWHTNDFIISYSNLGTGYTSFGVGNLLSDPMFVDAENGDYRLLPSSPCIDAGTLTDAPDDDLSGNIRDGHPDMGAYEYDAATVSEFVNTNTALKIYPNPANNFVYIEYQNQSQIKIFDLFGKQVFQGSIGNGINKIDVSSLSKGIYIVKTTNNETSKMIIN